MMEKENKRALKQKNSAGRVFKDKLENKSIKKRLLYGIIGMAVSISAIYGLINGMMFYRDAKKNIELRLTECATAYSQSVENSIDLYRARIEFIAQNPEITDPSLSKDQRTSYLLRLQRITDLQRFPLLARMEKPAMAEMPANGSILNSLLREIHTYPLPL